MLKITNALRLVLTLPFCVQAAAVKRARLPPPSYVPMASLPEGAEPPQLCTQTTIEFSDDECVCVWQSPKDTRVINPDQVRNRNMYKNVRGFLDKKGVFVYCGEGCGAPFIECWDRKGLVYRVKRTSQR